MLKNVQMIIMAGLLPRVLPSLTVTRRNMDILFLTPPVPSRRDRGTLWRHVEGKMLMAVLVKMFLRYAIDQSIRLAIVLSLILCQASSLSPFRIAKMSRRADVSSVTRLL